MEWGDTRLKLLAFVFINGCVKEEGITLTRSKFCSKISTN